MSSLDFSADLERLQELAQARRRELRCERCGCAEDDSNRLEEIWRNGTHVVCSRCAADLAAEWSAQDACARFARVAKQHPRMAEWSSETYPSDPAGAAALDAARKWLGLGNGAAAHLNLYLHGGVGSGKTGLAWAMLRQHVEAGGTGAFANVRDLLADVRRSYNDGEHVDPLDGLQDTTLLVLDDLGAERPTDWALETIATLVEHRYTHQRRTIITSNYQPSNLAQRLGRNHPVAGQRIISRLHESCALVHVAAPDRRVRRSE